METVEVLIRIPKEDFDFIKDEFADGDMPDEKDLQETTYFAIAKGKALPKGHGDLKDVQDIINRINLNYNNHQFIDAYSLKDMIATVPTIIEADKNGDINGNKEFISAKLPDQIDKQYIEDVFFGRREK